MEYTPMNAADIERARALFNASVEAKELLYKPFLSKDAFEAFFTARKEDNLTVVNIMSEDKNAFASGCYVAGQDKGYITFVAVERSMRRKGYGKGIIAALEQELVRVSGKPSLKFELVFFNPMNFSWIVPNTAGHDHPNAPGVDVCSEAYIFFKNCGYRDFAYQNSYHVNLATYEFPQEIVDRIEMLKQKGIQITMYDGKCHTGIPELLDNLNNELWTREITANVNRVDGGDPLLIVDQQGKAMGFTGPLAVQPSGRGYFCGIGVHSDCRGNGAGKVLFSYLCKSLKDMGAQFMTLFTGETNPARNIYEAAGFKVVRTWADMRKG